MKEKKTLVAYQIKRNGEHQRIEMNNDLQDYYKYAECSTIDIVYARIGDKLYDIICDDEGLLKENVFTAFTLKSKVMLAGTIVVVGSNGRGGFKSLTDKDLENIKLNLHNTGRLMHPQLAETMLEFEYANLD